jgi:hypothetical protein
MASKTTDSTPVTESNVTEALATVTKKIAKREKAAKGKRAKAKKPAKAKGKAKAKAAKPAQRADSKQAKFIAAMQTARGMSIDEAAKAFDWQKHTVRGAIAGAIKKRLGLKVEAEQDEERGTVYRIAK